MAGALEGIIKREDLDTPPQRVLFKDLVRHDSQGGVGDLFVPCAPDGRAPRQKETLSQEPAVSQEALDHRRREAIERETYQKAFAEAEKAGLALAEQSMERQLALVLPQFESALRELDGLPKRIFASAERLLVETAITLMRELLGHELTVHPEGIVDRVRRILAQSAGRRDIVIHVSPEHAALLARLSTFENLRIEADPAIAPGSVRMESDFGGMEDNLPQQLADMALGLRHYFRDRMKTLGCEDIAEAADTVARTPLDESASAHSMPEPDSALGTASASEPASASESTPVPESAFGSAPASESASAPEPTSASEQASALGSAPTVESASAHEPTSASESTLVPEPTPASESASAPEPTSASESASVPEPTPASESASAPEPTPASESASVPESAPVPESTPALPESASLPELTETAPPVEAPPVDISPPDRPPESHVSPAEAPAASSADEAVAGSAPGGETPGEGAEDTLSVEALTAGFATADLSQGIGQPAWLSEEEVEQDDDGIA